MEERGLLIPTLASLRTRAVRHDDHYVVNGQKVWTSLGHRADWCQLYVRTDPDAPKHQGISCFIVDMALPGITVRPLVTLNGAEDFAEVCAIREIRCQSGPHEEEHMIDFTDQVVIVTGAGRGLGRLYALELARRGASVVVNDLGGTMRGDGSDPSVADDVVAEIRAAGGSAVPSHDSVDNPEGGQAIVDTAVEEFGRLDAVVSNAGIFNSVPFDELSVDEWRQMLRVHLDGGFHLSQPAFRVMKRNDGGRFVFISSSAGMFGQPMEAHYAAAKTGLVGLSNVIAIEGAAHGIRSNTVLPTGFSRMVTETVGDEKFLAESGFMRAIRPELVVPLVTFLASTACTFTHRNYSASAGRYARVFVGLGRGWAADAEADLTADDIAAHLGEVSATDPYLVPESIVDEVLAVCDRLGISPMPDNADIVFPEPAN